MGKLRHNKDRGFLTGVEWKELGGFKDKRASGAFKRLPYDHCALSLVPFETPMLAPDGSVFELTRIVPFLKAHKKNPVTGDPLESKDLLAIHFSKNTDGNYICPVTGKPLTEHTRIVVVRTTGNVFSFDAVNQLCLGPKNMKDLLDDTPFTRADLVFIQDPTDADFLKRHDVSNFAHVLSGDRGGAAAAPASAAAGTAANPGGGTIRLNDASRRVFEEMEQAAAAKKQQQRAEEAAAAAVAAAGAAGSSETAAFAAVPVGHVSAVGVQTTGRFAASFTSTGVTLVTRNEARPLSAAELAERRLAGVRALGKKAFVRLETNHGHLNLELDVPLAPRTCENFLLLAKRGAYDGTVFHRSIRNFMLQGGDPTGTGRGGAAAGGKPLADEFHPKLSHSERGILSMANSGPNTTGSQFFITYKSCTYLDKKHNVFGRLVGGMDVLREIELIPTDKEDRPTSEVRIVAAKVFSDPFAEYDAAAVTPRSSSAPVGASGTGSAGAAADAAASGGSLSGSKRPRIDGPLSSGSTAR